MGPTALLLMNLGTPDSTDVSDVRRYLGEFLMDPYVIDIPAVARWLLVKGIILRFRPKKSAHAYEKIWTHRGSPLRFHTEDLRAEVARVAKGQSLSQLEVAWGMRYGNPSASTELSQLYELGHRHILVFPLYPQYALSSTETGIQQIRRQAQALGSDLRVDFVPAFYNHKAFISAQASVIQQEILSFQPDFLLLSYHGLPVRHVQKLDVSQSHCSKIENCCEQVIEINKNCYRAQCYATSRLVLKELNWSKDKSLTTFQSRLGRTPWIQPYTDVELPRLASQGVRRLAVACPSFVSDCLETLEEIGERAREDFIAAGGEDLRLVPSLNANPDWAKAVLRIALG